MRRSALRVPPVTLRYFDAGQHCGDAVDADWVLVEHTTITAHTIGFGQRLNAIFHPDLRSFTWCRHMAWVRHGEDGHDLSEMGPRGHERTDLETYVARRYVVAHFEASDEQRALACLDDIACAEIDYGFVQYAPLAVDSLTGLAFFAGYGSTKVCSTHTTELAIPLGLWPDRSPDATFPMHCAKWVNARW